MPENAYLIDLDGVLYVGDRQVLGAQKVIARLEDGGYRYRFLSNSTRKSRQTLAAKLAGMGFDITPDLIVTPAVALARYLRGKNQTKCHLLVTGDVIRDFEEAGIRPEDTAPCIVVGDAGEEFTYTRLNQAFRLVLMGAEIVALEKDRYWMGVDGVMLSAGPFVAALEYATGREATLIGKPSPSFFRLALGEMDATPEETIMVGDDIVTDIKGAKVLGMRTVLVKTGKYLPEALDSAEIHPDYILNSIADLEKILDR